MQGKVGSAQRKPKRLQAMEWLNHLMAIATAAQTIINNTCALGQL
jgi:hypothetical protein